MALAKKCDLCGAFYDHDCTVKHNAFALGKKSSDGYPMSDELKDCCPKCMSDILNCLEDCKHRKGIKAL